MGKVDIEKFVVIPGYNGKYLIDEEGVIVEMDENGGFTTVKRRLNWAGYELVSLKTPNGKRKVLRVHHLVLMTFRPEEYKRLTPGSRPGPDGIRYVTDHIDGNKANNKLSNLEVVDARENVVRAFALGLNPKKTPIIVKNYYTGVEHYFSKIRDCSKYIGLSETAIIKHVYGKNYADSMWPNGNMIRLANSERPWVDPVRIIGMGVPVTLIDLITGNKGGPVSIEEAARLTEQNSRYIRDRLRDTYFLVTRNFFLITKFGYETPTDINFIKIVAETFKSGTICIVKNNNLDYYEIYPNLNCAADNYNLGVSGAAARIIRRSTSNNQIWYNYKLLETELKDSGITDINALVITSRGKRFITINFDK